MSKNYGYTAGNLLDYLYHQKYYKLIGTDLSRQTNTSISQHINFIGRLEKDEGAAMFFIDEKQQQKKKKKKKKILIKINCFKKKKKKNEK